MGTVGADLDTSVDLLQAAWQLSDDEFEKLMGVEPGWLHAWRIHERSDLDHERVRRLLRFHRALALVTQPPLYGDYIRRRWRSHSPIGERSILEAMLADGDETMDLIEGYLRSQGL